MISKVQLLTRNGKVVKGRRIIVTSEFESNIKNIWIKIQDIETLREICSPKASFIANKNSPIVWRNGESFVFKLFLHKFIPIEKHTINVVKMDEESHKIDTNEYNGTVTIWNHYIEMEEISYSTTKYTNIVDLYAGWLTPFTAWWTLKFYQHRQRKWQKIAREL